MSQQDTPHPDRVARPTRLGYALRYVRRHGVRRTLSRVPERYIYGTQDFVITRVALQGPPVPDHVGDVRLRAATPSDLGRLDELERFGGLPAAVLRGYVEDGNWLFVAVVGDRVIAARITGPTIPAHLLTAKVLKLGRHQAWDEDMFCLPEYRGKGIARTLSLFSDRYMASLGYTEAFATISTGNIPSLRMQLHKGSEFAYHVSYRRVLFLERFRVSRDVPSGTPGTEVLRLLPTWRGPDNTAA